MIPHRLRLLGSEHGKALYSITKHAMRRSADEIGATSIYSGRKCLATGSAVWNTFCRHSQQQIACLPVVPIGKQAQILNVVVCSFVGWSLRMCFSFNVGQWVARPVCPAVQAANFGLLDLQLTEADRRPFKLPLQLGDLPIECLSNLPKSACSQEKKVSHQFSGEPKMRFVSTALVMMTIALMLLALIMLTPTVRANPSLAPTLVIVEP
jgi:hypothetical protein